jgi:hypothetical protein
MTKIDNNKTSTGGWKAIEKMRRRDKNAPKKMIQQAAVR